MLLKTHQPPVAGAVGEGEAGLAGEANHGVVGAQRIAEQSDGAERRRAAFQIAEQRRADAMALPAVVDRQAELEAIRIGVEGVASTSPPRWSSMPSSVMTAITLKRLASPTRMMRSSSDCG